MFLTMFVGKKRLRLLGGIALAALFLLTLPSIFDFQEGTLTVLTRPKRLVPIYYVDTPEQKVAFSFDATWGAERTPKILDTLDENEIETTFFLTGIWTEDYPEMVEEIQERGHEIGNHTTNHPDLTTLSREQIRAELKEVEEMIADITGKRTTLMRPPFGAYSDRVIETAEEMGYKTIQWSIDSLDWKDIRPEDIVARVTEKAHNGAIVLFHNNGEYTADVLQEIIDYYHAEGYEIVPISELIYHDNYYIDEHSGAQIRE